MYISVESQGSALIWTLNRPDRMNALGTSIGTELLLKVKELSRDLLHWSSLRTEEEPPYRCLVIRAARIERPGKVPIWIAGGDLKELGLLQSRAEGRAYASDWARICSLLGQLPIPVIAVIQGLAIGGGIELALAADVRLASRESELHFKQLEVGLATGYGSCQRLVALVGLARASDLLFRCRHLKAEAAHAFGLINDLADDDVAMESLLASICQQLAQLSAQGIMAQKRMLQGPFAADQDYLTERELDLFENLWQKPAHHKFLAQFDPPAHAIPPISARSAQTCKKP